MYIWRNKNRRDKRNHLKLGEKAWTASSDDHDHRVEDEILRQQLEAQHINYFRERIQVLITQYLETPSGLKEVEILRKELELYRRNQEDVLHREERLKNEAETTKNNLKLLFRQFGDKEYEEITRNGLGNLLAYLKMTMNQKQFELYLEKCGFTEDRKMITFEEFYHQFLEELGERDKKSVWSKLPSFFSGNNQKKIFSMKDLEKEEGESRQGVSVSWHLELQMKTIEAKTLIIEYAVHCAVRDARIEYRKAHAPLFACLECVSTFTTEADLVQHRTKETEYHRQYAQENIQREEKYYWVNKMLTGDQARTLLAQRLIFSEELASQQIRIDGAFEQRFRPSMADPTGKRHQQMLRGMFVTGFDPKSGVRPNYKHLGLKTQHMAPLRIAPNANFIYKPMPPLLQEVLLDLMRCQDEFIDTVSTQDHPNASFMISQNGECNLAMVRFEWNGYANKHCSIKGEFTNWKAVVMPCDTYTSKFFYLTELAPGKYRYRFIVDDTEKVDQLASQTDDPESPLGKSNEILITKSPIFHVPREQRLRGGGTKRTPKPETVIIEEDDMSHMTDNTLTPVKIKGSFPVVKSSPPSPTNGSPTRSRAQSSAAASTSMKDKPPGYITHISKTDKGALIAKLEHLNLRNLALSDDGVNAIVSNLHKNSHILSVDLSYNDISEEGIQALSGGIPLLTCLHTLKLNGNGFAMDSVRYLTTALKSSTSIRALELSNNRIGDDGMEVLCEFLQYNLAVTSIHVDQNLIGDDGFDCFAELLMINRTLTTISCQNNRMTQKSIEHICASLKNNASLTSMNISHNAIGADGVNAIGDMLYFTTTLTRLDMAHVDLFSKRSQRGYMAVCYGLKFNKSLTYLNLQNNGIKDYNVDFLAHTLTLNQTLQHIDLQYNQTKKEWYMLDLMIHTHFHQDMPSIATSLRDNKNRAKQRAGNYDVDEKRYIVDDCVRGIWTNRREWHKVVISEQERQERQDKINKEYARMRTEQDYIEVEVEKVMKGIRLYLDEPACKQYVQTVARFITNYLMDLSKFDTNIYHLETLQDEAERERRSRQGKAGSSRAKSIQLKQAKASAASMKGGLTSSASVKSGSMNGSMYGDDDDGFDGNDEGEKTSGLSSFFNLDSLIDKISSTIMPSGGLEVESFMHAHITVVHAIFVILEGTNNLLLHPERIQQAMQMLAMPLPLEDVQDAVDTIIVRGVNMLAIHKFSDYVLRNAKRLTSKGSKNKIQRMRILSDLQVNPPIDEAKAIILDNIHHSVFMDVRRKYRLVPENVPKYCCKTCQQRFASEGLYNKHIKRGKRNPFHKRMRIKEMIHHAQTMFLNQVKSAYTGVFFPAYFELMPPNRLPKNYCPQVFDLMGDRGRPFAVVEDYRTIRALDVLGDYLLVSHSATPGWIRYRDGVSRLSFGTSSGLISNKLFLRPIQGFDWDTMHIQDSICFYRVNDNLPNEIELKVRHRPSIEGEVIGYVKKGEMIQVMAVIDDWLQVKHGKEDAAWLLMRSPLLVGDETEVAKAERKSRSRIMGSTIESRVRVLTSTDNKGNATAGSPVRKRHVDKTITPIEHIEEDEDLIFRDHIVTYEINGKKYRNNAEKNPLITKYKIALFDELRYGSLESGTSSDHLLPVPMFIQKRIVPDLENLPPTPSELTQQQIFDIIVECNESELREWDLEVNGGFSQGIDSILNPFGGKSMRDDLYKLIDEEDQEYESDHL